mgnify:CR=1 FL=1
MKIYRNIIFLFLLLLLSCKDEPAAPPVVDEIPEEPEVVYVCEIGQTKNCTINENHGVCRIGVEYCMGTVWTVMAVSTKSNQSIAWRPVLMASISIWMMDGMFPVLMVRSAA